MGKIKEVLNNQGLVIEAFYSRRELEETFCPLLEKMTALRKEKGDRILVFLAAPPGAGKTTLSLLLEKLYHRKENSFSFQAIAMDGFHHTNDYLTSHYTSVDGQRRPLKDFKGKPETFHLEGLKRALEDLQTKEAVEWPIYSRTLHDIAPATLTVQADILLVEGNYLLLKQAGWEGLADYADFTIRLSAPVDLLKERLIKRKLKGGHSIEHALAHYERTDLPNHHLVANQSQKADWSLVLNENEEWVIE